MLSLLVLLTPPVHAQRYLSEFVGSTKVVGSAGVVALDTNLSFDLLDRRSLDGAFSFQEVDTLGNVETALFTVSATLAASGQCPARLSGDTTGKLQLDEYAFDASSFVLYGRFEVDSDPGLVKVGTGKLSGPTAMLNPPVDFLSFAGDSGTLELVGRATDSSYDLVLDGLDETGSNRGEALDAKGSSAWAVVLSANAKWLYLVATGESSVLMGRGAVSLDASGSASSASGSWEQLTDTGKVLDAGTFTVKLGG